MRSYPQTLNELFNSAVERFADSEFVRFRTADGWKSLSYSEVGDRVKKLALGLFEIGVSREDRIAIWSENRPEWNIADLACLALGAADVPIYTTQARSQVEYILRDSETKLVFASASFVGEVVELASRTPTVRTIICFDDTKPSNIGPVRVITLAEVMALGQKASLDYEDSWRAATPDDLATLLYTSGTTGEPKGVMLSHRNLTANVLNGFKALELGQHRDTVLTYLPFSHIFERGTWYLYAHCGSTVAYAESIDTVARDLAEVRPTIMTSVPRMFEKIYARILEKGSATGFPKRQIFFWSLNIGRKWAERHSRGLSVGPVLSLQQKIADVLVFRKWREAVGGRIRLFVSGGASLAPEIAYLFYAAGLTILEGYGLTETSPTISCNRVGRNRIGTVGPVLDGVEVKIAEDGEILVKGDTVMQGYYNRPEENREAFTEDGWFRTGDIGVIDRDGFLEITDRKKDLIKTSGGKYVAPQRIETMIKTSRFVSQVVIVGNRRKFPAALIVPNKELLKSYAELKGISYGSYSELLRSPRIIDLMERQVDKATTGAAKFEKPKRIALLEREFGIDSGELTPTLKPRRRIIETTYSSRIDELYQEAVQPAVIG